MQDLLNYLTRQMLHSVCFLTSSYFSKNWHSPIALHIRTVHEFYPFMTTLSEVLGTLSSAHLKATVSPADGCIKQNVLGLQALRAPLDLKPGLLTYFQVILYAPFQETQMLSIWQVCPNSSLNNMAKYFKYCLVFDEGTQGEVTSREKPSWEFQRHFTPDLAPASFRLQPHLTLITICPQASCWSFLKLAGLYLIFLPMDSCFCCLECFPQDPSTHTSSRHLYAP